MKNKILLLFSLCRFQSNTSLLNILLNNFFSYCRMSAGEDFITSDQLKKELNQVCRNKSISSDIIKVDENSKEYKCLKSSRQGTDKKKNRNK